ncbi:MAG: hypothetical protein Q4F83_15425 [Eubacteriales bacterium]|nr:hypothetical protein [Eubacteriales bacterium]
MYLNNRTLKKAVRGILLIAGCIIYTWMFPQIAIQGCVHSAAIEENEGEAAIEESAPDAERTAAAGREAVYLSEEDYIRLFDLSKSNFKVAWKWMPF